MFDHEIIRNIFIFLLIKCSSYLFIIFPQFIQEHVFSWSHKKPIENELKETGNKPALALNTTTATITITIIISYGACGSKRASVCE